MKACLLPEEVEHRLEELGQLTGIECRAGLRLGEEKLDLQYRAVGNNVLELLLVVDNGVVDNDSDAVDAKLIRGRWLLR